jgi:hypothetical protein
MKKKLAVLLAVASFATASTAMAATVYNSEGNAFGTAAVTTTSYKIAYEVYSNTAGATTIADNTSLAPVQVSYGQLNILLTQPVAPGQNVNIVINNGTAVFNSAGPGFNRYGLCALTTDAAGTLPLVGGATPAAIAAAFCAPGNIVATLPPSGVTTTNLGLQVNVGVVPGATGRFVRLVQWNDNGVPGGVANNAQLEVGEIASLSNGASLFVNPGLLASCSNFPIITMTVSTSGGESTASPFNFAFITPQFTVSAPSSSTLNAELNTDLDFTVFTAGSNDPATTMTGVTQLSKAAFFTVNNLAVAPGLDMWIDYAINPPSGTISYTLTSAAVEPGLSAAGAVRADGTNCTTTDQSVFSCSSNVVIPGNHSILVLLNGVGQNNPTNWVLSNLAISASASANINPICNTISGGGVGSWYGGIEAIVPFVKDIPGSYATFIKLYNRYSKAAKVYIADLNQVQTSIVTSIKQLGATATTGSSLANSAGLNDNSSIPINGYITITGPDLIAGASPIVAGGAAALAQGVPIKFLIRVPAQMGAPAFTTITAGSLAVPGTVNPTGSGAGVATASVVDPYISGIVVSTYNGGTAQRSVPLLFKSFKQGQYN